MAKWKMRSTFHLICTILLWQEQERGTPYIFFFDEKSRDSNDDAESDELMSNNNNMKKYLFKN